MGVEPFVEGDGEGKELLFAVECVDHFEVELGVPEGGVVELADVVEEVAGETGVGVDDGACEAEVVVVLGDLFIERGVVDGDGCERDLGAEGGASGEEAAVDVVEGGGGDDVVVGGDELDADVVEREGAVGVVGDDDADGDEAVLDVGEAEEVAEFGVDAGVGGDRDLFGGVGVESDVLAGGLDGWGGSLFIAGVGGDGEEGESGGEGEGAAEAAEYEGHAV